MTGPGIGARIRRLEAVQRSGEVRVAITPHRLHVDVWPHDLPWPAALSAGVLERRDGYCHRPENVAFAGLMLAETPTHILELGAGSGSLLLSGVAVSGARATAVELQPAVAERLGRTLQAHEIEAEIRVGDLRDDAVLAEIADVDLVVANPPFYPADWGRPSKDPEVHTSTHALHGGVAAFLTAASRLLGPGGVAWFVYDAGRAAELVAAAGEAGFGISRWVWIPDARPEKNGAPTRVWVRLLKGGGARIVRLGSEGADAQAPDR